METSSHLLSFQSGHRRPDERSLHYSKRRLDRMAAIIVLAAVVLRVGAALRSGSDGHRRGGAAAVLSIRPAAGATVLSNCRTTFRTHDGDGRREAR
jgi:hypothetical protein